MTASETEQRDEGIPVAVGWHRRVFDQIDWRIASGALVLVVLAVAFHLMSDGVFFTPRNLSLLLRQASIVAILAGGVSVLMIMAEIDLSIGSAVYLTGVVAGEVVVTHGQPTWVGVVAAIGAGIALGAWNGLLVSRLAVPSFVVTLAGLLMFQGIGLMWTDAATLGPLPDDFVELSEAFLGKGASYVFLVAFAAVVTVVILRGRRTEIRRHGEASTAQLGLRLAGVAILLGLALWITGGFLGLPYAVLWVIGVGAVLFVLMSQTTLGRNAYMIGANREAAYLSGINVRHQIFLGFILMGILYGVCGVLLDARLSASSPAAGQFLELNAIAAAVIGGTSLMGGVGTIPGAMVGALLLATIDNGMSLLNVNSFAQLVVKGLILVFAVALDQFANRRQRRL
ncbi:MAG: hypothetical protein U0R50_16110 [Gaiellales bacterium]